MAISKNGLTIVALLVTLYILETGDSTEFSSLVSAVHSEEEEEHFLPYSREKRDVLTDQWNYIVDVVSDVETFEQIQSFLNTTSLPIQLDNMTEISSISLTMVCTPTGAGFQCRCEELFAWPYSSCVKYGACDNISGGICKCINAIPADGQTCQPISALLGHSEYEVDVELNVTDIATLDYLRSLLTNGSFSLTLGPTVNVTHINITTVCYPNGTSFQCRCEDHFVWLHETCITYGACDDITDDMTCRCINAIPSDGQYCQPKTAVIQLYEYLLEVELRVGDVALIEQLRNTVDNINFPIRLNNTINITKIDVIFTVPPVIYEYQISIEVNTADVDKLRNTLGNITFPIQISTQINISNANITTVCSQDDTGFQCRCEDDYLWPCDKCVTYGKCEGDTNSICGCINAIPADGQYCQSVQHQNITVCPLTTTSAPPSSTAPPVVYEYLISVELNTEDVTVIEQLRTILRNISFPISINNHLQININDINISTVCYPSSTGFQCRCEDQYRWSCDQCFLYGSCDNITNDTCGCINALPPNGQYCQLIDQHNVTSCPLPPSPSPTTPPVVYEYLISIELNTTDVTVIDQLRNINYPINISSDIQISAVNISTVCYPSTAGFQCRCEDQYRWSCDQCFLYGSCDNITNDTCGCINALPPNGQYCQIVDQHNFTACPVTTPSPSPTTPPVVYEFLISIELIISDAAVINQLRTMLSNISYPISINNHIQINDINISTVCYPSSAGFQCRCEDQYRWSCDQCFLYGFCDNITNDTCGCINALPPNGQYCQIVDQHNITFCPSTTSSPTTTNTTPIATTDLNTTTPTITRSTVVTNSTPAATTNQNTTTAATTSLTAITNSTTVGTTGMGTTRVTTTPTTVITTIVTPDDISTTAETPTSTLTTTSQTTTVGSTTEATSTTTALTTTTGTKHSTTTTIIPTTTTSTKHSTTTTIIPTTTTSTTTTTIPTTTTSTKHSTTTTTIPTTTTTTTTSTTTATSTPTTTRSTTTASTADTTVTTATTTNTGFDVDMLMRLDKEYTPELNNATSSTYKELESRISSVLVEQYKGITGFINVFVKGFREGSIITDFVVQTRQVEPDEIADANKKLPEAMKPIALVIGSVSAFYNSLSSISFPDLTYTNDDMTLTCGPPANINVGQISGSEWKFKERIIKDSGRIKITTSNMMSKLRIAQVVPADAGNYECTLEGRVMNFLQKGFVTSNNIKQAPILRLPSMVNVQCQLGQIQPLKCCVQSNYKVKWFQGTTVLQSEVVNEPGNTYCITHNYNIESCSGSQQEEQSFICRVDEPKRYEMTTTVIIFREDVKCDDTQYGKGREGDRSSIACNKGQEGSKTAVCKDGKWTLEVDNCIVTQIKELLIDSQDLAVEEVPQFVTNLSTIVQSEKTDITNSSPTISAIVNILNTVAQVSTAVVQSVMKNVLETVDVIIGDDARESWEVLNTNETNNASSQLLGSMETLSEGLIGEFAIVTQRIQLNKTTFNNSFGANLNSSVSIDIPNTNNDNVSITTITFATLNNVMPARSSSFNSSIFNATDNQLVSADTINAAVVLVKTDASIQNVTLSFDKRNNFLKLNPQCVFWNFTQLDNLGAWDNQGCIFDSDINNTVTCRCNHLTSFSILMAIDIPASLRNDLAIITYFGVGISLASLVICLIIEGYVWKAITRNSTAFMRHVSIVNTALSLLIADICFLIGASIVDDTNGFKVPVGPCSTATFFMHFFYLALFFWMLVSGLLLFYRTVMVFSHMSKSTMLAIGFSLGYGCPLIIAVITVAVTAPQNNNNYIRKTNACWLNWKETMALLALVIPALTIVFINILIVIVVLFKMLRRGVGDAAQPEEKHTMVVITRCLIILTPLFGLTWSLGVGTMFSTYSGIHIAFAFFNSLQGFFILVFGTLFDSKIRSILLKNVSTSSTGSNPTRSTSVGFSSFSGLNLISRLRGRRYMYRVSEAANSSSTGQSESFVSI